jgi:hypothetical protein
VQDAILREAAPELKNYPSHLEVVGSAGAGDARRGAMKSPIDLARFAQLTAGLVECDA